ncbi:putative MFS transporter [Ascodesmis nigricans]|uniref:Putative MFS transporter n=1 Tax=Ascodesmis nigricans TaxID=341454 RepID=A0A4S2N8L5_9PEZI|nr:putative MFS transporter [Ascodesmis nigricans]
MSQGHETGVKREDAINPPSDAGREVGGDDEGSQQAEEYVDVEDEAKIRGVYRKLDRRIIPAFWVLYFLCAAVRSNVGLSLTMNSETGDSLGQKLELSSKQVSTGLALFYVCYVIFDAPANLIMSRISPHVWMSRIVIGTGILGCCHAALSAAWNFYLLRLLLGVVIAGMWPGMAYYLTLFYPPSQTGKRIGYYYTAAQVSAAVVGLVSAGFQKMNGLGNLAGFQWMFLLYGLITVITGFCLLWWLPARPQAPGTEDGPRAWYQRFFPRARPALKGEDAKLHYEDLTRVYHSPPWTLRDLGKVMLDWRLWPLTIMYFGVVGVGIGTQTFGTLIIRSTNASLTSIELSLLFAPIWICDLIAILIVTPISDRFNRFRPVFFVIPVCIQIAGLLTTTYASNPWARYVGLLIVGFGLGPTVPVCMTWTSEIFQPRHGEVGVAAASALVSGLGNLGSVMTTYALYTGWAEDAKKGPKQYRMSNLVMIGILALSAVTAVGMGVVLEILKRRGAGAEREGLVVDGAERRERRKRAK